ncbi:hypothetical protein [Ranid herpesvirus 3]|uniref:Uncharacterized protein n=1 Tax=Ranid herpesvirus 3 TaxID=1987509 RepID=A0A1X9T5C6_9VIRU|nr:hypothetical protein [Ranid herpesvirus 3]ARR28904.1 hypothetical protein [Ranid herpesvirus 3]
MFNNSTTFACAELMPSCWFCKAIFPFSSSIIAKYCALSWLISWLCVISRSARRWWAFRFSFSIFVFRPFSVWSVLLIVSVNRSCIFVTSSVLSVISLNTSSSWVKSVVLGAKPRNSCSYECISS